MSEFILIAGLAFALVGLVVVLSSPIWLIILFGMMGKIRKRGKTIEVFQEAIKAIAQSDALNKPKPRKACPSKDKAIQALYASAWKEAFFERMATAQEVVNIPAEPKAEPKPKVETPKAKPEAKPDLTIVNEDEQERA